MKKKRAQVVKSRSSKRGTRRVTYQLEAVRCGKATCVSCPHGPYWFAYWRHAGKQRKRYLGAAFAELTFDQLRSTERYEARKKARAAKKEQKHLAKHLAGELERVRVLGEALETATIQGLFTRKGD
jgi:hypothetical protein